MSTALVARRLAAVLAALVLSGRDVPAQGLSESTGVSQYFVNCAK